ncbi:MAG: TAXI family TRAP transporter solute-binding subunit [Hyphomicrobiaceae bacterium]
MREGRRFSQAREIALIALPIVVLLAGLLWLAASFAGTAPPTRLVIAAASKGSPYHKLAESYAPVFRRNGVELEVRESGGSFDNFKALTTPGTMVDVGFLQGGLKTRADAPGLVSVGRVMHEPLWVFYNAGQKLERLSDLAGRRILVGPAGGGTHALAELLLKANGITAANATLVNRELPDYVDLLAKGEADAGFLVLGVEARTIQRLFALPGVRLLSFTNAEAYTQRFPFLSRLVLREGVIDLGRRIPAADTTLIATSAAVLVRDETHHALVNLLAQALYEVHGSPAADISPEAGLFQKAGDFPTQVDPEFPMSEEARRVYRAGPPFLQRYLPFWLANVIDRLTVSLLVLVPLLVPLMRIGPQIYRWRVRRRILFWYGVLKRLEASAADAPTDRARHLAELDDIELAVRGIPVPLGFADQHYELRAQVEMVRARLLGRQPPERAPRDAADRDRPDASKAIAPPPTVLADTGPMT